MGTKLRTTIEQIRAVLTEQLKGLVWLVFQVRPHIASDVDLAQSLLIFQISHINGLQCLAFGEWYTTAWGPSDSFCSREPLGCIAHLDSKPLFSTASTVANSTLSAQKKSLLSNRECTFLLISDISLQEPGYKANIKTLCDMLETYDMVKCKEPTEVFWEEVWFCKYVCSLITNVLWW